MSKNQSMGKLKDMLKVEVRKIPPVAEMVGNTDRTPLDQFFFFALHLDSLMGQAYIDAGKVIMNPNDAKVLFLNFKGYLIKKYGEDLGIETAIRAWHQMGPLCRKEIPEGYVFLAPGHFLIKHQKQDGNPTKDEIH